MRNTISIKFAKENPIQRIQLSQVKVHRRNAISKGASRQAGKLKEKRTK